MSTGTGNAYEQTIQKTMNKFVCFVEMNYFLILTD